MGNFTILGVYIVIVLLYILISIVNYKVKTSFTQMLDVILTICISLFVLLTLLIAVSYNNYIWIAIDVLALLQCIYSVYISIRDKNAN